MIKWGEIKDPVHGYVSISEAEKNIIDTTPVQRLRYIKQLACAYLTYPGADHSRYIHSVGVMHVAGRMAEQLVSEGWLDESEIQEVRLAALLHDVGHGPFSHVYEELLVKKRKLTHEDMSRKIVEESEVGDKLEELGYSKKDVALLCVGKHPKKRVLNAIIAGELSADIIDYLLRDSHFTGAGYSFDSGRIIESMCVLEDGRVGIKKGALSAVEGYFIVRYLMFKSIYFHRTVRAAAVMLLRAMELADGELGLTSFSTVDEFLDVDDAYVIRELSRLRSSLDPKLREAYELMRKIRKRELVKMAYESPPQISESPMIASLLTEEEARRGVLEGIAKKAGVSANDLFLDVSSAPSVPGYVRGEWEVPIVSERVERLSELSPVVRTLRGYMNVVRVYTYPPYRERVREAASEVFGIPPSARVTY